MGTAALWMTMKEDYNYMIKGGPNPVWIGRRRSTFPWNRLTVLASRSCSDMAVHE